MLFPQFYPDTGSRIIESRSGINHGKTNDLKDERTINIITDKDSYIGDKFIGKLDGKDVELWALTRKNSRFIEAVINLDSNYGWDGDETKDCLPGYDPFKTADNNKKELRRLDKKKLDEQPKFYGSTASWFKKIRQSGDDEKEFKKSVAGVVTTIDITNSTRMSQEERKKLAKRIYDEYKNVNELKDALKSPLGPKDANHIFAILCQKVEFNDKKGNKRERYNVSFASKFCSYAFHYLIEKFENLPNPYSRYDKVVSEVLPAYLGVYYQDGRDDNKKSFVIGTKKDLEDKLDKYSRYCEAIGNMINNLPGRAKLSRDQVDHIIWYSKK